MLGCHVTPPSSPSLSLSLSLSEAKLSSFSSSSPSESLGYFLPLTFRSLIATNLISSVIPMLSPGYCLLYLFLRFIIGGALVVVVVVEIDGDGEYDDVLEPEQHRIRALLSLILFFFWLIVFVEMKEEECIGIECCCSCSSRKGCCTVVFHSDIVSELQQEGERERQWWFWTSDYWYFLVLQHLGFKLMGFVAVIGLFGLTGCDYSRIIGCQLQVHI